MNASSIYSGPAKIFYNSVGIFPQGSAGEIKIAVHQETEDVGNAIAGRIDSTAADCQIKVDFTPFDNWGIFATLFPAAVTTPAPGTRFGGATNALCKIWTPDQRLYTLENAFVSKHPEIHLGNSVPLWGPAEITGLVKDTTEMGTAASFYAVATGAADPGGANTMTDFIREPWTAAWGTGTGPAGFGGDGGAAMQAEEEIVIVPEIKYTPLKVQKLTRAYLLQSVKFMAKLRPVGPTHAQLDSALALQNSGVLGRRFGAAAQAQSLILTGAISGKTITLNQVNLVTGGYEFGGSKLGTGEIGFVAATTFSAGAIQAVLSHT